MILRLIWRNLWRNPRRTWITTSSIAFAVFLSVLMHSFTKGVFDHLIRQVVGSYSGHLQVHARGYWDEPVIDNVFAWSDSIGQAIRGDARIAGSVMRLETFVLASTGTKTKGCMLIGTDPLQEDQLIRIREKLVTGSYFQPGESHIIMADGMANQLGMKVGDTLVLLGQGYHGALAAGKYPISGTVRLPSPELNQQTVFMPVTAAQEFLAAPGSLTTLAITLRYPGDLPAVQATLAGRLPDTYEVMTWQELMPEIAKHIEGDSRNNALYSAILYIIIGFGFFGTVMMMTAERRHEFGMLLGIGMPRRTLGLVLTGEALLLTLLGAGIGMVLSFPAVWYFTRHPIQLTGKMAEAYIAFNFEPVFPATLDPGIFITHTLIVCGMALLIGLYPLAHVYRLDPIRAMRTR